jgi:hypothetical protein
MLCCASFAARMRWSRWAGIVATSVPLAPSAPSTLASRVATGRDCAMPADRGASDVANPGLVRPPFVYLAAILVGSALQIAWPLPFLPPGIAPLGAALIAVAAALFASSVRQFRAAGTPVPGDSPSTAVVRSGPLPRQPERSTWRSRCSTWGSRRAPTASGCSRRSPAPSPSWPSSSSRERKATWRTGSATPTSTTRAACVAGCDALAFTTGRPAAVHARRPRPWI